MSKELLDIEMPDGTVVEGVPKGTSKSIVMARYQKMKGSAKPPAPSDDVMAARKKESTAAFEKNRPAFEGPGLKTALDIPLDIATGVEQASGLDPMHPISTLPNAARGFLDTMGQVLSGKGPQVGMQMLQSAGQAVHQGGEALRQRNIPEAMQAAGRGYAAVAPIVEPLAHAVTPSIGDIRETATKLNVPQSLETRASANRAPVPPADLPTWGKRAAVYAAGQAIGAPHIAEGLIGLDFARRWQPYRNLKASMQERLARGLVDPNAKPAPIKETTVASKPIPMKNAPRMSEQTPFETESKSTPAPRKEIPFKAGEELTGKSQPNLKSIEEKIAPSGARAQQASQMVDAQGQPTKFGRSLLEQVPELQTAPKGPKADAALMSGYQRTLQGVVEAENAVNPSTPIDTTAIVSQLGALEAEYLEKGLTKTADAISKIQADWVGKGMTWGEFVKRKRAFFQERNLRSSPMRRAYGILMGESGRVSPELQAANSAYSTVRRALDNAKIDTNTGRRITQVGKTAKGKANISQMIEQSKPETTIAREPVKTRAEAVERLNFEQPEEEEVEPEQEELPKVKLHTPDF
jgi:hypothetical protein